MSFIYHEKVPEVDSLPTIKGASLVKGKVSGPDLLSRIVPMEAHEASSLYSEEQAKLLRTVCGKVEDIPNTTSTLSLLQELVEPLCGHVQEQWGALHLQVRFSCRAFVEEVCNFVIVKEYSDGELCLP